MRAKQYLLESLFLITVLSAIGASAFTVSGRPEVVPRLIHTPLALAPPAWSATLCQHSSAYIVRVSSNGEITGEPHPDRCYWDSRPVTLGHATPQELAKIEAILLGPELVSRKPSNLKGENYITYTLGKTTYSFWSTSKAFAGPRDSLRDALQETISRVKANGNVRPVTPRH